MSLVDAGGAARVVAATRPTLTEWAEDTDVVLVRHDGQSLLPNIFVLLRAEQIGIPSQDCSGRSRCPHVSRDFPPGYKKQPFR